MTVSTSNRSVTDSSNTGLNRPFSSYVRFTPMNSIALSFPFSPINRVGPRC
ncbi:hypothetical protein D3C83_225820 [compost metagenome]